MLIIPSCTNFNSHRNFDSPDHLKKYFSNKIGSFEHPRSTTIFSHFINRTSTIKIHNIKTQILNNFS